MKFLRKKGFSLLELLVVIAIIALLVAMILPSLSSQDANKTRAIDASKDFYTASQYLFSKFAKVESELTEKSDSDTLLGTDVLCYDKEFGGNRPVAKYVAVCLHTMNGKVVFSDAYSHDEPKVALAYVLSRKNQSVQSKFEQAFNAEANALFEAQDGYYYAIVRWENEFADPSKPNEFKGSSTVKVVASGFSDHELKAFTGDEETLAGFDTYKNSELLVTDFGSLSNGHYFGIQSSEKVGEDYIGDIGTYFCVE